MVQIEKCNIGDLNSLQQISIQTFRETYTQDNGSAVFEKHIESTFNSTRLSQDLNSANSSFYLLRSSDLVLGYFKINWGAQQSTDMGPSFLEIERIYLLKSAQNKGYGSLMINHIVTIAKEKKFTSIWLGVWQKNPKAIQFYKKMNFIISGSHVFMLDNEAQEDYIMQRSLKA